MSDGMMRGMGLWDLVLAVLVMVIIAALVRHLLSKITAFRRKQANRSPTSSRLPGRLLLLPLLAFIGLLPLSATAFLHVAIAGPDTGRALYLEHCAACHGFNLEGQPDWRSRDADGLYPAPPHDETGHTWHHDDAMLVDYIARGGQAVLDDIGVTFTSGMPGFGSVLDEREIEAILDYIKSTWPKHIQDLQAQRSNAAASE